MKYLIVRSHPTILNIDNYNVQEIGLAKSLIRRGHICDIVLFSDTKSRTELINVGENRQITIYWEKGTNIFWQGIYDINNILKICGQYDYVQVNEYNQLLTYQIISKCSKPVVIYHGPYYNSRDNKYNFLNKIYDLFFLKKLLTMQPNIYTKSVLAEKSLRAKGFENVKTVGVGLDFERFDDLNCDNMMQSNTLLYVGEWSERRNTLFLLEVFKELNKYRDYKLVMIGTGKPKYVSLCMRFIESNNLQSKITIIDSLNQSDLTKYYKNSLLFLLPTNYEIFGMVMLESLYFGLPVISTVNGGSVTLLTEKYRGVVVESLEIKDWVSTIIQYTQSDYMNSKYKAYRREFIEKYYSWDAISFAIEHDATKLFDERQ